MSTFDITQTAELLEALRGSWARIPEVLAALCGLRRGEIAALRWRHIDLASGRLAITESAEQTASGVRYKPPKSRRARTVALSATVRAELRVHKARQAEELLGLGVRQSKDTFVYAREDGAPMQPRNLTRGLGASAEPDRVAVRSLSRSPSRACDAPSGQWRTSEGRL